MKKSIAILGSTGSIGQQALEVISNYPDFFETEVITANNNADLLIQQAIKYQPNAVVIANEDHYKKVQNALSSLDVKVYAGEKALSQIVEMETIDVVLTAMVGYSGLVPTINAIKSGKKIALANKETLVVAGELITNLALDYKTNIYPVDSEHSAIFQCLVGESNSKIEKVYLTASGGPFRQNDIEFLKKAKKEQALKHPNWEMGSKVTIDSATMMNKGLEAIEAKWLFELRPDQIDVIIHPQSIVHSLVQFEDGSMKAQMGLPDMKLPIQYALSFPYRFKNEFPRFNFMDYPELTFEKPDLKKFRNLALAFSALEKCGNMPCIMNASNEIVVEAFLQDKIGFLEMSDIIEKTMNEVKYIKKPSFDELVESNTEARKIAKNYLK